MKFQFGAFGLLLLALCLQNSVSRTAKAAPPGMQCMVDGHAKDAPFLVVVPISQAPLLTARGYIPTSCGMDVGSIPDEQRIHCDLKPGAVASNTQLSSIRNRISTRDLCAMSGFVVRKARPKSAPQ